MLMSLYVIKITHPYLSTNVHTDVAHRCTGVQMRNPRWRRCNFN